MSKNSALKNDAHFYMNKSTLYPNTYIIWKIVLWRTTIFFVKSIFLAFEALIRTSMSNECGPKFLTQANIYRFFSPVTFCIKNPWSRDILVLRIHSCKSNEPWNWPPTSCFRIHCWYIYIAIKESCLPYNKMHISFPLWYVSMACASCALYGRRRLCTYYCPMTGGAEMTWHIYWCMRT